MKDNAVSPVIGVLLMLVVTIIIAAVVSGFAGGLAGGTSKSAQVSLKAEFHNSTGLFIDHLGGNAINTLKTKIIVSPTSDFGNYDQLRWEVNPALVLIKKGTSDKPWNDPAKTSGNNARTFQPGERAILDKGSIEQIQPLTYGASGSSDAGNQYYGFCSSTAQGQRFNLMLVDDAGRTIAQTEVVIQP